MQFLEGREKRERPGDNNEPGRREAERLNGAQVNLVRRSKGGESSGQVKLTRELGEKDPLEIIIAGIMV